jgi:pantoate--beta-alanine ligase
MKIITRTDALKKVIDTAKEEGRTIGFVPTMGALHEGHLSLIRTSLSNGDFLVVSIFVNPTQFNDPGDLERYPRNMEADMNLLKYEPVDLVFAPEVEEMYPENDTRVFDLAPLDSIMEGKYRPGHFNGVAQIVSKLFYAVMPDRAYFGQKDFQQLAVIKRLVSILRLDIEIIECPTIREKDGLAMSSRNQLLTKAGRAAAPFIYQTLQKAVTMKHNHTPDMVREFVNSEINNHPLMDIEYFEIVEDQNFHTIQSWETKANIIGCIAVQLNGLRLIDNVYFH